MESQSGAAGDEVSLGQTWQDPRSGKVLTAAEQLARLGIKPEDYAKSIKDGVV